MQKVYPKIEKAYLVATHHYCFRVGEPCQIIGVIIGQPDEQSKPRLCYEVEYYDGVKDMICVSEVGLHYDIITFDDIRSGKFSKKP